jgi:hypothetical protein
MAPPDRARLRRAAASIEAWLDTNEPDAEFTEAQRADLLRVSELALSGASEAKIGRAIGQARDSGWGWEPIAVLLGESPEQARQRAGDPRTE